VLVAAGCGGNSDITFAAAAWKAVRHAEQCDTPEVSEVRKHMVADLLDTRLRPGMTQRELKAMLGPPEEEGGSAGPPRTITWYWHTGNDGMDCTVLVVGLISGRVVQFREGHL
jgi:hypothetical protein